MQILKISIYCSSVSLIIRQTCMSKYHSSLLETKFGIYAYTDRLILNVKSATNEYLTTIPKMCWFSIFPRTSNEKLFSINEEVQREALKGFYDR